VIIISLLLFLSPPPSTHKTNLCSLSCGLFEIIVNIISDVIDRKVTFFRSFYNRTINDIMTEMYAWHVFC